MVRKRCVQITVFYVICSQNNKYVKRQLQYVCELKWQKFEIATKITLDIMDMHMLTDFVDFNK